MFVFFVFFFFFFFLFFFLFVFFVVVVFASGKCVEHCVWSHLYLIFLAADIEMTNVRLNISRKIPVNSSKIFFNIAKTSDLKVIQASMLNAFKGFLIPFRFNRRLNVELSWIISWSFC